MWFNPDLEKSYFDGENINSVHSSALLLKVTIISYQWWYVAFPNIECARIMTASEWERDGSWL